jgi:hypothetical protein
VISKARRAFWQFVYALPPAIQELARAKFVLWQNEPFHPSLHFKELRPTLWSVRINDNYRALAVRKANIVAWFWIGTHAEYDNIIYT